MNLLTNIRNFTCPKTNLRIMICINGEFVFYNVCGFNDFAENSLLEHL